MNWSNSSENPHPSLREERSHSALPEVPCRSTEDPVDPCQRFSELAVSQRWKFGDSWSRYQEYQESVSVGGVRVLLQDGWQTAVEGASLHGHSFEVQGSTFWFKIGLKISILKHIDYILLINYTIQIN